MWLLYHLLLHIGGLVNNVMHLGIKSVHSETSLQDTGLLAVLVRTSSALEVHFKIR